eukprot:m.310092 g.310092  ORF g.310092 m.310092 type:complete len:686 (+) comp49487_c0_seq1:46-2103(+)
MAWRGRSSLLVLMIGLLDDCVCRGSRPPSSSSSTNFTLICEFYQVACTKTPITDDFSSQCEHYNAGYRNCTAAYPLANLKDLTCLTIEEGNRTAGYVVRFKDCFVERAQTCDCSVTASQRVCCCRGNYCNKGPIVHSTPSSTTNHPTSRGGGDSGHVGGGTNGATSEAPKRGNRKAIIIAVSLCCSLLIFALVFVFFLWYYCLWKKTRSAARLLHDEAFIKSNSVEALSMAKSLDDTALLHRIGSGRFAEVWKVAFMGQDAAVKIFPENEKISWKTEVDTYSNPKLKSDGILRFWAAEKRCGIEGVEYWLMTDYHSKGSLNDFLRDHIVDLRQMCVMADSLAFGLAYLHSKCQRADGVKLGIAHRDLKSRNVLIKDDGTCCISDFGLAVKFQSGQGVTPAHGQVGTVRYMAPEVLEGAINFQEEAFMRTDVYALALMFWEIGSRCCTGNEPVQEYQQPYEDEVPANPSIEEMHEVVVVTKFRPVFSSEWHCLESLEVLRQTIEECWDSDAEARLTAECVQERIKLCREMMNGGLQSNGSNHLTGVNDKTVSLGKGSMGNGSVNGGDHLLANQNPSNGIHPSHYYRGSHVPNMSAVIGDCPAVAVGRQSGGGFHPVLSKPSRGAYLVFDSSSSSCPPPYTPTVHVDCVHGSVSVDRESASRDDERPATAIDCDDNGIRSADEGTSV